MSGDARTSAAGPQRDPLAPRWLRDILRLETVRPVFVLSGNIRDRFLFPTEAGYQLLAMKPAFKRLGQLIGLDSILWWDLVDGLEYVPVGGAPADANVGGVALTAGQPSQIRFPAQLLQVADAVARTSAGNSARRCLVLDFSSRIGVAPGAPEQVLRDVFLHLEKLALNAQPGLNASGPIVLLVNRVQDIPSWFLSDCERVHRVEIELPRMPMREAAARILIAECGGGIPPDNLAAAARVFAETTDGFSIQAMRDVCLLEGQRVQNAETVDDAVRDFRNGDAKVDNPWRPDVVGDRVQRAMEMLPQSVLGQEAAVTKALDILRRTAMGLSGSQAASSRNKPRGVLFLAGPTGVGKTELAKTLATAIFGSQDAMLRFDMSEYSAEHAEARLIGAPPGYVGYESGGQLTDGVRRRPFSVILFDEIEKAHSRILDKFLQVLDEGRLTDGRGETVYFTDSIVIFTSNAGIYVRDPADPTGRRRIRNPAIAYDPDGSAAETIGRAVRAGVEDYFRLELGRPELLNRIGDNVIVFQFISRSVGRNIADKMLGNITGRLREEHGAALILSERARHQVHEGCEQTAVLENGGRGVGNFLESALINPLARVLFGRDIAGKTVKVAELESQAGLPGVRVEVS